MFVFLRNVEADVALRSTTAVFTYCRSRGLFAGISLEGSYLIERKDTNRKYELQPPNCLLFPASFITSFLRLLLPTSTLYLALLLMSFPLLPITTSNSPSFSSSFFILSYLLLSFTLCVCLVAAGSTAKTFELQPF